MSCEQDTRNTLHQRGRRVTSPRMRIASVLRHGEGHRSAEEIHREVDPEGIALSTVYRTLDTLTELRLVSAVDEGGSAGYQWLDGEEHHHHLRCHRCGAESALEGVSLELLSREIAAATGFEAYLDHLSIPGLCAACRDAEDGVAR